ncbi:BrnT family toxin [Acuticoccus sp. M5D2P5]|uniref:BrnT family toxin n=1 Tax=Acuticoccus kalidii TaxID=2910977 RepID=UPI001F38A401|nr:BrnT family toxin [Acuticoccus kalidii]MCF3935281.1 BrnT family toxin [Acuticoccus kalidii]
MNKDEPDYQWDDAKSERTRADRGFGFDIIRGFDWDYAVCLDVQNEGGEEREKWIGPIGDRLFAVVITLRGDAVRVISLRRAEQTEIAIWRKDIGA